MTNELEQLKRLVEARAKATGGPWETYEVIDNGDLLSRGIRQVDGAGINHGDDGYEMFRRDDTDFIALAGSTDLQAIFAAWEKDRLTLLRMAEELSGQQGCPVSAVIEHFTNFPKGTQ